MAQFIPEVVLLLWCFALLFIKNIKFAKYDFYCDIKREFYLIFIRYTTKKTLKTVTIITLFLLL